MVAVVSWFVKYLHRISLISINESMESNLASLEAYFNETSGDYIKSGNERINTK